MPTHNHKINREKFLAEMERRGWKLDAVGWIVPPGRTMRLREEDWYASVIIAIECECPPLVGDPQVFGLLSKHRDQTPECAEHRGAWASFMHECVSCLRYGYAFQFNQRCGLLDLCAVLRKMDLQYNCALNSAAIILDKYRKEHPLDAETEKKNSD